MPGVLLSAGAARFVSIVLHPFVVFAALALVAAWRIDPASLLHTVVGIAAAIAVVSVFIWQRRRSGHWQTVDASRPQERPLLYLLALAVAGGYWLWMGGRGSATSGGVLAAVAMLCAAGLANRWIKLSLHMASLAFAAVSLLVLVPWMGAAAVAMLPVLGAARVRMGRHTRGEVLGGTVLGAVSALLPRLIG
ncbi:hypothetical protein [Luteimonas deserti]|uniref:Phosphatase PAP2 family protein n=1 Tax=Luteimonas deserti TaxID=2752306 RepID=A0A7Z0TVJ8_9GAMM|nr:hypothetical protein [Luteimonas deserti]NYZ63936.1 hypothetical protein [Luteimonas deserti]